jgi:hypothetical protein
VRVDSRSHLVFVTCGEEVEWSLITVVRNMGKCYRVMHLSEVAIICFHFCLDSASESDYVCVPEKQKRVINGYNTGALLWMPDTDFIFLAENTMLVAMCMLVIDRREPAINLCDTAFDMYMASKDSVRPVHAFVIMSISCCNSGAYAESAKYAHAVCVYARDVPVHGASAGAQRQCAERNSGQAHVCGLSEAATGGCRRRSGGAWAK